MLIPLRACAIAQGMARKRKIATGKVGQAVMIETRLLALEHEREIRNLYVRYCDLVDAGKADLIAEDFYTNDVLADYHYNALSGRDAIHKFYISGMDVFSESAHCLTNLVIQSCDGEIAEVTSVLMAFHWHGAPEVHGVAAPIDFGLIVRSEDRLRRTSAGWRVAQRRARAMGPSFALKETELVLQRKD